MRYECAPVAQGIEHRFNAAGGEGSNPSGRTTYFAGLDFFLGLNASTFLTAVSRTAKSILGLSIIAFLHHWQPVFLQSVVYLVGSAPDLL